jgi:hypothetical protein
MKQMKNKASKIIGRREYIDLNELGVSGIEAKIDTGAYTSALHCKKVTVFEENAVKMVKFSVLDAKHLPHHDKVVSLPLHKTKRIKSSNGVVQLRHIIKTEVRFGGMTYKIEFSLADRSRMEYPILIGRKALHNRFVVDVSKTHLTTPSE